MEFMPALGIIVTRGMLHKHLDVVASYKFLSAERSGVCLPLPVNSESISMWSNLAAIR